MLRAFANGRLFGERYGGAGSGGPSEPWLLALHGWQRTHADFAGVLGGSVLGAARADGALDAIALDLPGFGAAPPPPEAWGSSEYAEAIAAVLDEMAPRVILLAHSFGGRVAVHLAAAHPDRIVGLVLTGVPLLHGVGRRAKPALRYRVVRRLARSGLVGEERLEAARQRYGSADYRAATGIVRDVFVRVVGEEYEEQLRAIRCPTVLVWGEDDTEVPVEVARRAQSMIPGAELQLLFGVGHLAPTAAPAALRAAAERLRP